MTENSTQMAKSSTIDVRVVPSATHVGELGPSQTTERFKLRVAELGDSIGDIANDLRDRLDAALESKKDSAWALREVELAFSLDLEAEHGVVVAKAKASAGFEARLTWSRAGE